LIKISAALALPASIIVERYLCHGSVSLVWEQIQFGNILPASPNGHILMIALHTLYTAITIDTATATQQIWRRI
jgi:hypothetical protein